MRGPTRARGALGRDPGAPPLPCACSSANEAPLASFVVVPILHRPRARASPKALFLAAAARPTVTDQLPSGGRWTQVLDANVSIRASMISVVVVLAVVSCSSNETAHHAECSVGGRCPLTCSDNSGCRGLANHGGIPEQSRSIQCHPAPLLRRSNPFERRGKAHRYRRSPRKLCLRRRLHPRKPLHRLASTRERRRTTLAEQDHSIARSRTMAADPARSKSRSRRYPRSRSRNLDSPTRNLRRESETVAVRPCYRNRQWQPGLVLPLRVEAPLPPAHQGRRSSAAHSSAIRGPERSQGKATGSKTASMPRRDSPAHPFRAAVPPSQWFPYRSRVRVARWHPRHG
jgi:hypothetical protein